MATKPKARSKPATPSRATRVQTEIANVALTVVDLAETVRKLDDATTRAFETIQQRLWKIENPTRGASKFASEMARLIKKYGKQE